MEPRNEHGPASAIEAKKQRRMREHVQHIIYLGADADRYNDVCVSCRMHCRRKERPSARVSQAIPANWFGFKTSTIAEDKRLVAAIEKMDSWNKTEIIHRRGPWRHLEAVEYATLEWVDWLNHRRLLEPIGNVPPAELGSSYHHSTRQLPVAA